MPKKEVVKIKSVVAELKAVTCMEKTTTVFSVRLDRAKNIDRDSLTPGSFNKAGV